MLLSILAVSYFFSDVICFNIPGVALHEFKKGDPIDIQAVKMTSVKTQIPYRYYSLPFCEPEKRHYFPVNLGEILRGDKIVNTGYVVHMDSPVPCQVLCGKRKITKKQTRRLVKRIREDYVIHMIIDNLPGSTEYLEDGKAQYEHGYKLGRVVGNDVYLNNHLQLIINYNNDADADTYRVVGFRIRASSISNPVVTTDKCILPAKTETKPLILTDNDENEIQFTFGVYWKSSNIKWASRWDQYLQRNDVKVHWFAIVNSTIIVLFLTGMLAIIIIRTLRRDIAKYNESDVVEDIFDETGWKLVHGDVFRPPTSPLLLSALVGCGVQLYCMVIITMIFALVGMLSPASRGSLMTAVILSYVFMGMFAGYFAGRLYKTLNGLEWHKAALATGILYPGAVCAVSFFLNLILWGKDSSGAIPFTTMLALFGLWFCISIPLVHFGTFYGYQKAPYSQPVRTTKIPRQVPEQTWYLHPISVMLIGGVVLFGAVFIELFLILTAIWENQFYYLFGFLFLTFVIISICCSEISIVMVYFQLCGEDHHWWWRSFLMSGGGALYIFGYTVYYFFTKLEIVNFVSALIYFGYSFIMCFTFWVIAGTIKFYSTFVFVSVIYSAVKTD